MLRLPAEITDAILCALNAADARVAQRSVHQRWIDAHSHADDMILPGLLQSMTDWLNHDIISPVVEREEAGAVGEVTDYFFVGALAGDAGAPLHAFRLLQTVFAHDPVTGSWTSRPWKGADTDPLMNLPYITGEERDRVLSRERAEQREWEALCRAYDLVGLIAARIIDLTAADPWCPFLAPDVADIDMELASDDLHFAFAGDPATRPADVILSRLGPAHPDHDRRDALSVVVRGRYDGPYRSVQAATFPARKKMALGAVTDLERRLGEIIMPGDTGGPG